MNTCIGFFGCSTKTHPIENHKDAIWKGENEIRTRNKNAPTWTHNLVGQFLPHCSSTTNPCCAGWTPLIKEWGSRAGLAHNWQTNSLGWNSIQSGWGVSKSNCTCRRGEIGAVGCPSAPSAHCFTHHQWSPEWILAARHRSTPLPLWPGTSNVNRTLQSFLYWDTSIRKFQRVQNFGNRLSCCRAMGKRWSLW